MRHLGYEMAELLGLRAYRHDATGHDGIVYLVEDDMVLKVSDSATEAAVALALKRQQSIGETHPAVPWVHDVFWIEDVCNESEGDDPTCYYGVLRDDFHDIDGGVEWDRAVSALAVAWRSGDDIRDLPEVLEGDRHDDRLRQIHEGLCWIECRTGICMSDVKADNIGLGPSGWAGMRDLSRARVPARLMLPILERDFRRFPVEKLDFTNGPRSHVLCP